MYIDGDVLELDIEMDLEEVKTLQLFIKDRLNIYLCIMKNLLIFLGAILFLTSCFLFLTSRFSPPTKKKYTIEITYTNGDIDTLVYRGIGNNRFRLKATDFIQIPSHTLLSGVRTFNVLSIKEFGSFKEGDKGWTSINSCGCDGVTLESKPKIDTAE